jgi:aspartyl aminopeptidase
MAEIESKYAMSKKAAWEQFTDEQLTHCYTFADEYKTFLNEVKTEREAVAIIKIKATDAHKQFFINKEKEIALVHKGKKPLNEGIRIVIAHIDSPRLDLKQNPLFEDGESHVALFETHYYGGIKKYHWVTIPLALHGIIIKKDGEKISISIGEKPDEPVFAVPDLLPHLSHEIQDSKKLKEAIKGESLDIVVGSQPVKGDYKEKIKEAILQKLHTEYGLIEEDFTSAELEAVPAYPVRDLGFDRSMVAGYGQDDRVSAYTTLKAFLDINQQLEHTAIALFVDKEEIGSEGNTAAQVTTFLRTIIRSLDEHVEIDEVMLKSKVISADVNAAVTPNYSEVFELKNASKLGFGVVMSKYTGHGGKYSAHDASAEYVADIRTMLNTYKIPWQTGELGKVDKGGGGTVAKYFARLGMEVIDLGPPVLSMHSPYEVTSKADIYATYLAYKHFLEGK